MKTIICVFVALLAVSAVVVMASGRTSISRTFLQQSEEEIKAYILEFTPIGMDMDEARGLIEQRFQVDEWAYGLWAGQAFIDHANGVVRRYIPGIDPYMPPDIGVQSINLELGSYRRRGRLFGFTFVYVGWGFDENAQLVDVHVSKSSPAI